MTYTIERIKNRTDLPESEKQEKINIVLELMNCEKSDIFKLITNKKD